MSNLTGLGTCDTCGTVNTTVAGDEKLRDPRMICRPCTVKFGGECIADAIFGPVEPCIHPGLFAVGAPRFNRDLTTAENDAQYDAWLDSTRRCIECGADVAMRDL